MNYILSIDQGTTSSRSILFDEKLNEIAKAQLEFTQYFPQPGWVEHDPEEIWNSQLHTIREVIIQSGISISDIKAIGITNQRETVVVWNKHTGKPIHHAIVWQDRRTAEICEAIKEAGHEKYIREQTGLVLDAYFSGTKIKWILENVPEAKELLADNALLCGTIDTWLIWKLTGGKIHATDVSNASRTMLMNIHTLQWDENILQLFEIPLSILPAIKNSADDFGATELNGIMVPICGVAGDQQAALFGQRCFSTGAAKNTYGTGCFMLMNIGAAPVISTSNLLTTVAWKIGDQIQYALEGSVFIAGAVIQWLRDQLQIISTAEETASMAMALQDNGGVYFVPAFTGLGAPHWDMYARGIITGLTRGTNKQHIVRAALESIAYQTRDIFTAMQQDAGIYLKELRVDGGASSNNWLMQFQSDQLQVPVIRPENTESTAMGAAMLAGIGAGMFQINNFRQKTEQVTIFQPQHPKSKSDILFAEWQEAVAKCKK